MFELFNSQFDPWLNNVHSTNERHQKAMNSSLNSAELPDGENRGETED